MLPLKNQKIVLTVLLIVGLGLFLVSCQSKGAGSETINKQQIGVIVSDGKNPNTQVIKKEVDRRLKKEKVQLIWLDSGNDVAKEQENADALLKRKVDVVVLEPIDETLAAGIVGQFKQEKIKVVSLDKMPPNTPLDGHIKPDIACAGNLQAQFVLDTLALGYTPSGSIGNGEQKGQGSGSGGSQESGQSSQGGGQSGGGGGQGGQGGGQSGGESGQGGQEGSRERPLNSTVLLLCGPKEDKMSTEASVASRSVLATNPSIVVKEREVPAKDSAEIDSMIRNLLNETSEMPGFVLANESQLAESVLKYLQQEGRDNQVITVGLGGSKSAAMALASGRHNAEIDVMPEVIANQISEAAIALSEGEHWSYDRLVNNGDYQVPLRLTPVRLVKPENAFLLEERWGNLKEQGSQGGQSGGGGSGGSGSSGSQSGGGSQSSGGGGQGGQGGTTTTVTIKTTEGKTFEMKIEGEVQSIESKQEGASGGEGGGGSSGGGGSGGQGGGSAGIGGG